MPTAPSPRVTAGERSAAVRPGRGCARARVFEQHNTYAPRSWSLTSSVRSRTTAKGRVVVRQEPRRATVRGAEDKERGHGPFREQPRASGFSAGVMLFRY